MADPFVAEIRIFPFTFPPKGWAFCNGQLLPISQNTALFALLGTMYGGDGKSTFGLPDLRGSAPMFFGQGNGLSQHDEGEIGGAQTVTLLQSEIPAHTHSVNANGFTGDNTVPGPSISFAESTGGNAYAPSNAPLTQAPPQTLAPAGGGLPHNNMMPFLTLNFCIAMQGVFPPRK